jgi:mRNA interferase MazF
MGIYRQHDIILIPFPFSDLSGQKVRPVLLLSNDAYNQLSADVLVCGLTTNLRISPYSVIISVDDVEVSGSLKHASRIKTDTIASIEQSLLTKPIARLKLAIFNQVVDQIEQLVRSS